jgi:hypothetical protein
MRILAYRSTVVKLGIAPHWQNLTEIPDGVEIPPPHGRLGPLVFRRRHVLALAEFPRVLPPKAKHAPLPAGTQTHSTLGTIHSIVKFSQS